MEHPHHRVAYRVHTCQGCGASLGDSKPFKVDVRQVFDFPPVTIEVTQYDREVKSCRHCHAYNKRSPHHMSQMMCNMVQGYPYLHVNETSVRIDVKPV